MVGKEKGVRIWSSVVVKGKVACTRPDEPPHAWGLLAQSISFPTSLLLMTRRTTRIESIYSGGALRCWGDRAGQGYQTHAACEGSPWNPNAGDKQGVALLFASSLSRPSAVGAIARNGPHWQEAMGADQRGRGGSTKEPARNGRKY